MDNKEFAKVLLCEATTLLNEDARWNKELSKRAGEESTVDRGRKLAKEIAKAKDSKNSMEKALAYKKIHEANKDIDDRNTNKDMNRKALATVYNDIKNNSKKDFELHDIINDDMYRGLKHVKDPQRIDRYNRKKSQNESIELAILLTEAAELLNEVNYTTDGNELYADGEFIGTFSSSAERHELEEEYEEELKNKENK